jgi:hypothetical protein
VRLGNGRVWSHKRDGGSSERDAAEKRRSGGVVRHVHIAHCIYSLSGIGSYLFRCLTPESEV